MELAERAAPAEAPEERLPPVTELCIATMVLVVIGGIFIAAHLPKEVPMTLPYALVVAAIVLLAVNVFMVSRIERFAWDSFFQVGAWSFAAYIVIAGMLEFIFVYDDTPGRVMVPLTLMLAVYAVDIPLLFAFSVARYQPASRRA